MPFLRFARDKRGVETTALLQTSRGHGKGKPRLLYWFRTPPDIRVGRAPIDETVIAELQQAHPDVAFDWPQILHASKSLSAAGERRARDERSGQPRPSRKGRTAARQTGGPDPAVPAPPPSGEPASTDSTAVPPRGPEHRRRSRRGGSRRRPKGGSDAPPGTSA